MWVEVFTSITVVIINVFLGLYLKNKHSHLGSRYPYSKFKEKFHLDVLFLIILFAIGYGALQELLEFSGKYRYLTFQTINIGYLSFVIIIIELIKKIDKSYIYEHIHKFYALSYPPVYLTIILRYIKNPNKDIVFIIVNSILFILVFILMILTFIIRNRENNVIEHKVFTKSEDYYCKKIYKNKDYIILETIKKNLEKDKLKLIRLSKDDVIRIETVIKED